MSEFLLQIGCACLIFITAALGVWGPLAILTRTYKEENKCSVAGSTLDLEQPLLPSSANIKNLIHAKRALSYGTAGNTTHNNKVQTNDKQTHFVNDAHTNALEKRNNLQFEQNRKVVLQHNDSGNNNNNNNNNSNSVGVLTTSHDFLSPAHPHLSNSEHVHFDKGQAVEVHQQQQQKEEEEEEEELSRRRKLMELQRMRAKERQRSRQRRLRRKRLLRRTHPMLSYANYFSAGMLIAMACDHFLPSAFAHASANQVHAVAGWVLVGLLLPAMLECSANTQVVQDGNTSTTGVKDNMQGKSLQEEEELEQQQEEEEESPSLLLEHSRHQRKPHSQLRQERRLSGHSNRSREGHGHSHILMQEETSSDELEEEEFSNDNDDDDNDNNSNVPEELRRSMLIVEENNSNNNNNDNNREGKAEVMPHAWQQEQGQQAVFLPKREEELSASQHMNFQDALKRVNPKELYKHNIALPSFSTVTLLITLMCFHAILEGLLLGIEGSSRSLLDVTLPLSLHKFLDGIVIGVSLAKDHQRRVDRWLIACEEVKNEMTLRNGNSVSVSNNYNNNYSNNNNEENSQSLLSLTLEEQYRKLQTVMLKRPKAATIGRAIVLLWLILTPLSMLFAVYRLNTPTNSGERYNNVDGVDKSTHSTSSHWFLLPSFSLPTMVIIRGVGSGSFLYIGLTILLHDELRGLLCGTALFCGTLATFYLFRIQSFKM